jgi:hypothetical protein
MDEDSDDSCSPGGAPAAPASEKATAKAASQQRLTVGQSASVSAVAVLSLTFLLQMYSGPLWSRHCLYGECRIGAGGEACVGQLGASVWGQQAAGLVDVCQPLELPAISTVAGARVTRASHLAPALCCSRVRHAQVKAAVVQASIWHGSG